MVACVGGGSNALGIFTGFLANDVLLFGVEAGGSEQGHSAALALGSPGVLHGSYSYLLQDDHGQVLPAHSIAAGLDYPGVGPQHSELKDSGRVTYGSVTDQDALAACGDLCRLEGIIPALETAHAIAYVIEEGSKVDGPILICLSGRGDKDVSHVAQVEGVAVAGGDLAFESCPLGG